MEEREKISENFYQTIFRNLPFIAFTLDRHGRLLDANKEAERATGMKLKDLKGKRFSQFGLLGKKDLLKAFIEFRKNLQGKVTDKTVYKVRLRNGEEKFIELIGIPLKEEGKVIKVLDVGRDITEELMAERELKESEEKYRTLVDNAIVGVYRTNLKGEFLFANRALAKIFGFRSIKEMIDEGVMARYKNPDDRKLLIETLKKKGKIKSFEVELLTKTGKVKNVILSATLEGDMISGMIMDVTKLKRAEEKIRESERKYRLSFDNSRDAINIFSKDRKILDVNKKLIALSGYSKKELLSMKLEDLFPEAVKSQTAERLKKLLSGKEIPLFETYIRTKKGKDIPVEIGVTVLKNCYGRDVVFQGNIRDITERKKAQEEIRESEEKFRTIFENVNDGMVYLDRTGRIIDINEKALRMLGGSKKEVIGKHFTKLGIFSPEEMPTLMGNFKRILTGREQMLDIRIKNKKGENILLECSASLMKKAGEIIGVMVVARDVTKQNKVREEIKRAKEFLETIIETTESMIVGLDLEGRIKLVNRAFEQLTGYKRDEILGKKWFDMFMPERLRSEIKKVFEGVKTRRTIAKYHENPILTKSGEERTILWSNNVIKNEKGEPEMIISIGNDVTERKRMEEELKKRTEEAERFTKLSVGRELKMIELKKKIRSLEEKIKGKGGNP